MVASSSAGRGRSVAFLLVSLAVFASAPAVNGDDSACETCSCSTNLGFEVPGCGSPAPPAASSGSSGSCAGTGSTAILGTLFATGSCSADNHAVSDGVYTQSHNCGHYNAGFRPLPTGTPTHPTTVHWSTKTSNPSASYSNYFLFGVNSGGAKLVNWFYIKQGVPKMCNNACQDVQSTAISADTWYDFEITLDWDASTTSIKMRETGTATWSTPVNGGFRSPDGTSVDSIWMYNYDNNVEASYKNIHLCGGT